MTSSLKILLFIALKLKFETLLLLICEHCYFKSSKPRSFPFLKGRMFCFVFYLMSPCSLIISIDYNLFTLKHPNCYQLYIQSDFLEGSLRIWGWLPINSCLSTPDNYYAFNNLFVLRVRHILKVLKVKSCVCFPK